MFKKLVVFFQEVKVELRDKTTWPTKDDVLNSTVVAIVSILVVSAALYLVDMGSSVLIQYAVVDYVSVLKQYLNEFSYLIFVIGFTLLVIFYLRVKSRLSR